MKKTWKVVIICIVLLFSSISTPNALASTTEPLSPTTLINTPDFSSIPQASLASGAVIQPFFTYINSFTNGFDVINGKACMTSYLSAYGVTNCRISMYLYKYNNGTWYSIGDWTTTSSKPDPGNVVVAMLEPTPVSVTSGQYRIRVYGYTYKGFDMVESTEYLSYTVTY